jgi:hypothetical protein
MMITKTKSQIATIVALLCLSLIAVIVLLSRFHAFHTWDSVKPNGVGYELAPTVFADALEDGVILFRRYVKGDIDHWHRIAQHWRRQSQDDYERWEYAYDASTSRLLLVGPLLFNPQWKHDWGLIKYLDSSTVSLTYDNPLTESTNQPINAPKVTFDYRVRILWISKPAVISAFILAAILFLRAPFIRRRRKRRNQCLQCGYDLTALTSPKCPECGLNTSIQA